MGHLRTKEEQNFATGPGLALGSDRYKKNIKRKIEFRLKKLRTMTIKQDLIDLIDEILRDLKEV